MATTFLVLLIAGFGSEDVGTKFIASGALASGMSRPLFAELNANAQSVKKAPQGLVAPKYGRLKIGSQIWPVVLDLPEGKPPKIYVDTNADGDLTNDLIATWTVKKDDAKATSYMCNAEIDLVDGNRGSVRLYLNTPKKPRPDPDTDSAPQPPVRDMLLFYEDYGYELTLKLDGQEFVTCICGKPADGVRMWIDRDSDQRISPTREFISIGTPFNFTGTTYVLALEGDKLVLNKPERPLPLTPLPPNLGIGKKAPAFVMEAMDGATIDFPKSYAGKIVMLDFWATWCGPCVAELPNVKKAYEIWHDQGFEVLGISFDDQGMAEQISAFIKDKGMPWPQIYEGKLMSTTVGTLYDVPGLPFVLLVDGDSGEILGMLKELRGPGLSDFVGKALKKKRDASP